MPIKAHYRALRDRTYQIRAHPKIAPRQLLDRSQVYNKILYSQNSSLKTKPVKSPKPKKTPKYKGNPVKKAPNIRTAYRSYPRSPISSFWTGLKRSVHPMLKRSSRICPPVRGHPPACLVT